MELLLGCGNYPHKRLWYTNNYYWDHLVRLDIDPNCRPDVLWDLNNRPLPFEDNTFDELHAYDVLEHLGRQGDWRGFFEEFTEYWRILKPNGLFFILVPKPTSVWAWADPGHTRVLSKETFSFLDQRIYGEVGQSARTDYRFVWKGSFEIVHAAEENEHLQIIMKAIKDAN